MTPGDEVLTVTANPAVDHTVQVPGFRAGAVNRVAAEEWHAGGKGVNVAAFLAGMGVAVRATGFLGRPNASVFEEFFASSGIAAEFVPVEGTTRTGIKIVDDVAGATTDLNFPGFSVTADDVRALEDAVRRAVAPGRWVVLAGSLPPGAPPDLYRRLVELAHEGSALVAVDTSGPALGHALDARPDLVKPNAAELEELTGRRLAGRPALVEAAQALAARGIRTVVVSLGADGAVFTRDGEAVLAVPPPVRVASTVGAGDAMVAGSVTGHLRKLPLERVAALATAFSAVAISRVAPQLDSQAVEQATATVAVERLP